MDWRKMAREAEGLHTIESFASLRNIHRKTAVVYLYKLRAEGYVKTLRGKKGKRLYDISPARLRETGNEGFFDVLNENSSLKIQKPFEHRIYGRSFLVEEAIIEAIRTRDYRIILASLELFRKVRDWHLLYRLAKENGLERPVGALYALARRLFRVRRMDGRILRRMRESPLRQRYMVESMKSSDFRDIEHEWHVFIPFSRSDLHRIGR